MRNTKHLARLYDALQRGDEEEAADWRVDADEPGARASDQTVYEAEGGGLFDDHATLPRAAIMPSYLSARGAGHNRHRPRAATFAARGFKETSSEGAII